MSLRGAWKATHEEDLFAAEVEEALKDDRPGLITLWSTGPSFLLVIIAIAWVFTR